MLLLYYLHTDGDENVIIVIFALIFKLTYDFSIITYLKMVFIYILQMDKCYYSMKIKFPLKSKV